MISTELLMIKGAISELSEDDRKRVENAKEALKELIEQHGDSGLIALTWLTVELTNK